MNKILIIIAFLCFATGVVISFSGCATEKYLHFYKDGNVKIKYERDGFIPWSKKERILDLNVSGVGM
jgi:hypothetical protein